MQNNGLKENPFFKKVLSFFKEGNTHDDRGSEKLTWESIGWKRLVVIFLAGVCLLYFSVPQKEKASLGGKGEDGDTAQETAEQEDELWKAVNSYAVKQEEKLEKILSRVNGVGKVDVMLTIAASEEKKMLKNDTQSSEHSQEKDSTGGTRTQDSSDTSSEVVLVEGEDEDSPYVIQIQSPKIEGIVVVAQGAGNVTVDSQIIEAVEALFPIEAHKIKVMKMAD